MENIVNKVKSHALGVAEYFAPVLKVLFGLFADKLLIGSF